CAMRWSGRTTTGRPARTSRVRRATDVSDAFQVDSSQLFRHAANVRAVRDPLRTIKGATLGRRPRGQDHLYTYVEENLQLLAEALDSTGRDYDAVDGNAQSMIRAA